MAIQVETNAYRVQLAWLIDFFGTKITGSRRDFYLETITEFPLHVVEQVFKRFAKQSKTLPTIADVEKECIASRNYFDTQQPMLKGNMKCQYWFQGESLISRNLCEGYAEESSIHFSIMQFGKVYCNWHYMCAYAKKYPADTEAMKRVQFLLKDAKRRMDRGIDVPEFDKGTGEIFQPASNLAHGWRNGSSVQEGVANRV